MKNFPLMRLQTRAQFLALSAAFLLGGCGGNGVSSAPYVPPCPSFPCEAPTARKLQTPDDAEFENRKKAFENSPEYRPRWVGRLTARNYDDRHKEQIKASAAYARGATGKGEVVAVSDTYIFFKNPEVASKVTVAGPQDLRLGGLSTRHGTSMASLIAGKRDKKERRANMHGVAFDADVVFKQADLTSDYPGDAHNRPDNLDMLTEEDDKHFAARFFDMDYARAAGAGILNTSFGLTGHIDLYPKNWCAPNSSTPRPRWSKKASRPPTKSSLSAPPEAKAWTVLGHVTGGIPG